VVGEAKLLRALVAFTAVPVGPLHAQLTIFPEDPLRVKPDDFERAAASLGV
jgi:hypothetical protein